MKAVLRLYQTEALNEFLTKKHGTIAFAPGLGKTITACAAIEALMSKATTENTSRGMGMFWTLVVVPTLDLLNQWERVLKEQGIQNTNVITYALASRMAQDDDSKEFEDYSLIILDEVHHVAEGPAFKRILIPVFEAPFALGLTSTPPTDPENLLLRVLPVLYTRTFEQGLNEGYAAPIEVHPVPVKLTNEERKKYNELTEAIRVHFLRRKDFASPLFTKRKQLVSMATGKFDALVDLVATIVDQDNPTRIFLWSEYVDALKEAKRCLDATEDPRITSAVVTGETPKKERIRLITEDWGKIFRILLTAKVAEEGLDSPETAHGIILAGARTSRQNVQRVGRLLRPVPGKKAKLWVIFAEATIEEKLMKVIDEVT